jgi:predicted nucleotidyltransferase
LQKENLNKRDLLRRAGVFEMIDKCRRSNIEAEWFVFGSVSRGNVLPNDIDILCVAESSESLSEIWHVCEDHLLRAPIHLRVLSSENEIVFNFKEKCCAIALA